MYIKAQDAFGDVDLSNLRDLLALIDGKLSSIAELARRSADPDSEGLFDESEYFIGVAFTAMQQYLASTYAQFKIGRWEALQLPPRLTENLTFVEALNAGASFWKHRDEWGLRTNVTRDVGALNPQARQTIKTIEALTPWDDYTLCNLLACLTLSGELHLAELVPKLIEWRHAVDSLNREVS